MLSRIRVFLCRSAIPLAAVAAIATSPPAPLAAQNLSRDTRSTRGIEEANRLIAAGQFEAAKRVLKCAVSDHILRGTYPASALRRLAHTEFLLGNNLRAAAALDELAGWAAEFGDPESQIRALLDAALLYQDVGRRAEVASRATRIRRLLQSPALAADVADEIRQRLIGE